ncbi:M56 family metallopeptidase [Kribbella sp. NPDC048928]|uniref:M56 family metallopeptidase n=1 Tax=Kribbella sp. NPDC048928 TaxID=3364111 RepID=UPI0037156357
MTTAAVLGLIAIVGYALLAPIASRRLAPSVATKLLVAGNLLSAASGVFILAVLAFTWIGQFPLVAQRGAWSPAALHSDSPVPAWPAALAGCLVLLALFSVLVTGLRQMRALVEVHRACRGLTAVGDLVVLDDERPDAFSTPQPAGRVIVTSGLLRALDPRQRDVLLAHEKAHLLHHHAWWNLAAGLTAAVNPVLRPAARAAATAVERWADEDAARAVGDRRLVATTLVRVAQLQTRFAHPASVVAATGGDLETRVRALLAPPPRPRPLVIAALIAVFAVGALPAAAVQHTGERLFEHAERPVAGQHT